MLPTGIRPADFLPFAQALFDRDEQAKKAAPILKGILDAGSPRLSDISQHMPGSPTANYKAIQRLMAEVDFQEVLLRLFDEEAPFYLADVTEISRRQAKKTSYVGRLSDGKTLGFALLVVAQPYRGRAIPFAFVTYSERTLNEEGSSRNWEHLRAFWRVRDLIGEKPLVLDREFSYLWLYEAMVGEEMPFVVRLNTGNRARITDGEGKPVGLVLRPGDQVFLEGVNYLGQVRGNLAGIWEKGWREPMWVFTSLAPAEGLRVYRQRMKIEESFKDLKSLLHLEKVMNKKREKMERVVALVLLAYALGLLIGEALRDRVYGGKKARALLGAVHPSEAPGAVGPG